MTISRIDQDRKVMITDTGREIPIPDDTFKDLMRKAGRSKQFKARKESIKRDVLEQAGEGEGFLGAAKEYLGPVGAVAGKAGEWAVGGIEKAGDYAISGGATAIQEPGLGQEEMGFLERWGENYQAVREGKAEGRAELAKKYPKSALAGNITGLGLDLATMRYLPTKGALAAPIIGAMTTDVNILEDPAKWIGGRATDVVAGYAIDKTVGGLVKIAKKRAAAQAYPGKVRAVEEANALATQAFKESEVAFKEALKKLPAEQQKARRVYGNRIRVETQKLGREMSVDRIPRSAVKVERFVNDSINASELVGTAEGKKLSGFFTSLVESRPENLGWKDVAKLLTAVEDRIIVADETELPFLLKFKEHLVEVIPRAVGEASAQRKFLPKIIRSITGDVETGVKKLMTDKNFSGYADSIMGKSGERLFQDAVVKEVKVALKGLNSEEIAYMVNSGEIGGFVQAAIENSPTVKHVNTTLMGDIAPEMLEATMGKKAAREVYREGMGSFYARELTGKEIPAFAEELAERVNQSVEKFAGDLYIETEHVSNKVAGRLQKTLGAAEELAQPRPPAPLVTQPIPEKEALGFIGGLAEKPVTSLMPSMKFRGMGGLGKAAMIGGAAAKPLIAGGVAAGAAAGTAGLGALKMATDPGKLGDITRRGISYFGKALPSYLESKYESFENGVLTSPEERLQASIEIENDPYLSNQNKAIWQTRINKGQRLR